MNMRHVIGTKLIDPGTAALARGLHVYRRRRRQQQFTSQVVQALTELGLDQASFDQRAKLLLAQVCVAWCDKGARANAHALAIEFFFRFAVEYPHLVDKAVRSRGMFVDAVSVIRMWHLVNRIDAALAEASTERIKGFLVGQLRSMEGTNEERLQAELHIREL